LMVICEYAAVKKNIEALSTQEEKLINIFIRFSLL